MGRPKLGCLDFPGVTIVPLGPPRPARCSASCSPPSRPPPTAPALANSNAGWVSKLDHASVRRWAIENQLAPDTHYKLARQPVKRWKARDLGALWQYVASPHVWLPGQTGKQALLEQLDDATRYNVGARLYHSETLLAHLDFLARTFQAHRLPLVLYVDFQSFFYTRNPDAFTQLGQALHLYGVALRYAPIPLAKGKIERRHVLMAKTASPAPGRRSHP
jgi:hypothetical protein